MNFLTFYICHLTFGNFHITPAVVTYKWSTLRNQVVKKRYWSTIDNLHYTPKVKINKQSSVVVYNY